MTSKSPSSPPPTQNDFIYTIIYIEPIPSFSILRIRLLKGATKQRLKNHQNTNKLYTTTFNFRYAQVHIAIYHYRQIEN